jgi:chromosome segregation ATPase
MESAGERPDLDALHELEEVLRHLSEELGAWRRRALSAEARVSDHSRAAGGEGQHRLRDLEEANHTLEQRLETARVRVAELIGRLDFLEQQAPIAADHGTEAAK